MGAHPDQAENLQLKSFQVLSCVAPLIWIKLVCYAFRMVSSRADVPVDRV